MGSDLRIEAILLQIKDKLNRDQVKLWLPPYYIEDIGCCEAEIERLSQSYACALHMEPSNCLAALHELQAHAIERLHERNRFRETGVATLKVRVPNGHGRNNQVSLAIQLSATGRELQAAVATEMKQLPDRVKLIWSGKVLKPDLKLETQGLKHGMNLMALVLHGDPRELQDIDSHYKKMESTKADARLLAGRSNADDDYYLQVADQSGKMLSLPPEESRALVVAMSLHEKGRTAMKSEDYALALVLLLEADKEFSICNSKLLQSVDNYAVLNLDIAWCYLCLRSVTHIPDAEERLKKCEQNFQHTYGPNLERLMALKGSVGNEAALFMRLHLLQAITLFHQNKRPAAASLLNQAETELANLKVDDTSMCTLLELGYTASEARISLRATHGDVQAAAELINQRHQEREETRKKEEAEFKLNRERKRLGKCADGAQFVEPSLHKMLLSMGFDSEVARSALQQTNNSVSLSVQLIQEQPNLLICKVSKESLQKVIAVGFDPQMAKVSLKKHHGNVEKAIEELLSITGVVGQEYFTNNPESDGSNDSEEETVNKEQKCQENRKEEERAYKRLVEGISTHEEDHLDLTLVLEEAFLNEYKALLSFPL